MVLKGLEEIQQHIPLFLPYQVAWLKDGSLVKVWEKSRRIGATFVQSYEDVRDIIRGTVPAVWFSSADETAAREYIIYCMQWIKLLSLAKNGDEAVLDIQRKTGTLQIHFANGRRITALTSNPKAFRSKGGKVVLDEFAHHDDDAALWKAAKPAITWGYPLRILSTHNGKQSLFYQFVENIKKGTLPWSLHTTGIHTAVDMGLADKILQKRTTKKEREAWLNELRESCFDEIVWNEEFCCVPVDESTALLSYKRIAECESPDCLLKDGLADTGEYYAGIDIGRKNDYTVLSVVEKQSTGFSLVIMRVMKGETFIRQKEVMKEFLSHPKLRRCCIDATGMGMPLAEELQKQFGTRVEGVNFTAQIKEELAYTLLKHFEEQKIVIPSEASLRDDLHSIRRMQTSSGNTRFDAARTGGGHGDRFWSLALALHAAQNAPMPIAVMSNNIKRKSRITRNFI